MRRFLTGLAAAVASFAVSAAEVEHRQHDAHVHGVATLNIAVEGRQVLAELITPAMNILGFEHRPRTAGQEQALRESVAALRRGEDWLALPGEAGCRLVDATIESALLEDGHDANGEQPADDHDAREGEDHAHDHDESHDHGDEHDHDERHEHGHDETHSEFRVSYAFDCANPAEIDAVAVRLFDRFPGIEKIEFQALSASAQSGGELSPGDDVIALPD